MKDFLRIYVIWAPNAASARLADLISRHFDGIGMERDGVAYRIPVRFRSDSWEVGSIRPRPIDFSQSIHNAVVLLHDDYMNEDAAAWNEYVAALRGVMAARVGADVYIPFGSPLGDMPLACDASEHIQYARRDKWVTSLASVDARDTRLLLHLVFKLREHFRSVFSNSTEDEPLFVSHAKADGDVTARAIVDYVNSTDHDVPLQTFYDAMELSPGDDYQARFEKTISRGTLLAIVSDVYDSRPWCVYELTAAKRAGRPIVLADVGQVRTSRTYPYGANLPRVRVFPDPARTEWIEPLLVQVLSEGLRCDLFGAQARLRIGASAEDMLILPRPPELFDIVERSESKLALIYPDPPLGRIEIEILKRAMDGFARTTAMLTLSEFR